MKAYREQARSRESIDDESESVKAEEYRCEIRRFEFFFLIDRVLSVSGGVRWLNNPIDSLYNIFFF